MTWKRSVSIHTITPCLRCLGTGHSGDYFKEDAIDWAWELLTERYKLNKEDLYVTVFEGDKDDNLEMDAEALQYWKKHISEDRILPASKKDNFWEMGETGPCGPVQRNPH